MGELTTKSCCRRLAFALAAVLSLTLATRTIAADADTPDMNLVHSVEEVGTPNEIIRSIPNVFHDYRVVEEVVAIEKIVNLAQKIWKIIEDNKPVVDVKYMYANAVPKGVPSTEELEGFSPIQYRSFRHYGKNGFGATVYDLTYTILHRYNGSYRGKGRYLDAVTVLPHKVEVLWGYKMNYSVDRVSTVNVGDSEKPVASILMELGFKVATVIKESQFRQVYEFRGDSPNVRSIQ